MKPRRLLIVADTLVGGQGAAAARHAEWFAERGWETAVAGPVDERDRVDPPNLHPVRMPPTVRDLAGMAAAAADIRRARREVRPDVVHCHGARALAATRPSGPAFMTLHSISPVSTDPRGYARVRRAGLAVIPRLTIKAFTTRLDAPGRWVFAPQASDRLARLAPLSPPTTAEPTFLWVGRLAEPRRPELFVQALATLAHRRPTIRGVMAGSGPLAGEVERLVAQTGAPVELLGHRTDIDALLAEAWAVAVLSHHEGFSFAVQEALWSARPVVASALAGNEWLVGDRRFLVENVTEVAAAFDRLCDPEEAVAVGASGAARLRERLRPDDPWPLVEKAYG